MKIICTLFLGLLAITFLPGGQAQQCYKRTRHLLRDMQRDVENGSDGKEYTICADTKIRVGNPILFFLRFNWFQQPLLFVGRNNTIKCGDDGSRENNCIFQAKGAVFLFGSVVDAREFGIEGNTDISGTTLKGLTFRGRLQDPFPIIERLRIFTTFSTVGFLDAPGTDVVLEDCAFVDLNTDRIFNTDYLLRTDESVQPIQSLSLTIRDSYFKDISFFSNAFFNVGQDIRVENCIFDNIVSNRKFYQRNSYDNVALAYSVSNGTVAFEDVCVTSSIFGRMIAIYVTTEGYIDTEITFTNCYGDNVEYNEDDYNGICGDKIADFNGTFLVCLNNTAFDAENCAATTDTYVP